MNEPQGLCGGLAVVGEDPLLPAKGMDFTITSGEREALSGTGMPNEACHLLPQTFEMVSGSGAFVLNLDTHNRCNFVNPTICFLISLSCCQTSTAVHSSSVTCLWCWGHIYEDFYSLFTLEFIFTPIKKL